MIRFKCNQCGKVVSGRTEYDAEVKFNNHRCAASRVEFRRVDRLVVGDRFRVCGGASGVEPIGDVMVVDRVISADPAAVSLGIVGHTIPWVTQAHRVVALVGA